LKYVTTTRLYLLVTIYSALREGGSIAHSVGILLQMFVSCRFTYPALRASLLLRQIATQDMASFGASWASIAGKNATSTGQRTFVTDEQSQPPPRNNQSEQRRQKREPSPAHVPKTESPEENVYVLTLSTDKRHHKRMTALRDQYFPKKINKLGAHLTLFHALPATKLESDIVPTIQDLVSKSQPFKVHAAKPFRMKKGMAITVPKNQGGQQSQDVHRALQDAWSQGWLSEQDAGGMRVHYTIMNKVDDAAQVEAAFQEVQNSWQGDWGTVEGLDLWRYDRGYWRWERKFEFPGGGV